jgi:hypothetical protein
MAMLRGFAPEPPSNWGERRRGRRADEKKSVYDFSPLAQRAKIVFRHACKLRL